MISKLKEFCAVLFLIQFFIFLKTSSAQETKIQDNSFLIEEAYNQEAGVVQHINAFNLNPRADTWDYTFTQEWPVISQDHQFSYTLPVSRVDFGDKETGLADVLLNYRYQAVLEDKIALSPRVSLILPTGDSDQGLGADNLGYQVNLPLSVELNSKLVNHWNLGATFIPDAQSFDNTEANNTSFNFGTSFIYLATANLNFMLEIVGSSEEVTIAANQTEREDSFFISPGLRYAFNFDCGLQVVPGFAVPIGVGPSQNENNLFFYLSLEHAY